MHQWRTPAVVTMVVVNIVMLAALAWAFTALRPGSGRPAAPAAGWLGALPAQMRQSAGAAGAWRPQATSPREALRPDRPIAWLGLALALVGSLWFYVAAFRQGIGWGLACLLLPFAQLIFLVVHFGRAARPTALILFGTVLMLFL